MRRLRRYFANASLSAQLLCLTALCLVLTSGAALFVAGRVTLRMRASGLILDELLRLHLTLTLCLIAPLSIGLIMAAVRHLLLRPLHALQTGLADVIAGKLESSDRGPAPSRDWQRLRDTFDRMVSHLRQARTAHEQAEQVLAERSLTVDRLLEFCQTIQGAGTPEQIFATLARALEVQLGLSGLAILAHHAGQLPAVQVKAASPADLFRPDAPACEMNAALCPCLRQNLPREFKPQFSTVRCALDASLSLATDHPAYCIPFNVGEARVVVHMLLPLGSDWGADRRQLAQTYVNSAVSALISMHLLAEAEKQSMTDGLTGLFNRRSMVSLLQREVALAERHHHPLSLVMLDLDHFKQINDVHGHAAGDHMLKAFADCVRITLRKTDLAFRYGGDEFVIALPQTPLAQAQQVVEKLRQAYAAVDFSHAITRLESQPTLSIGLTERQKANGVLTLDNLLASADEALYDAKTANRNCVKIYQPTQAA